MIIRDFISKQTIKLFYDYSKQSDQRKNISALN